jgi:S1-C subfamily serine protease
MKISYRNNIVIALIFLVQSLAFVIFSTPAEAHNDFTSHQILKGIGDAHRALMDLKNGMGRSVFTLYAMPNSTVSVLGSKNSGVKEIDGKFGTAFIPACEFCNGRYLLTNKHVSDLSDIKQKHKEHLAEIIVFPPEIHFELKEGYKAVDPEGVSFGVSLVAVSATDDIALFRFDNPPNPPRKSFIFQDETDIDTDFSYIGIVGSPSGISDTLRTGTRARNELDDCGGDEGREYLMVTALTSPGNSGGFVYNFETDKVNGMVMGALTFDGVKTGLACAVPASVIIKFLQETLPLRKKAEAVNGG